MFRFFISAADVTSHAFVLSTQCYLFISILLLNYAPFFLFDLIYYNITLWSHLTFHTINTPMNYQYLLRKSLLLLRYPWTRNCNLGPFWGGWSYVGSAWCRFISVKPDVIIYWLNSTAVYGSTYLFFLKVALEMRDKPADFLLEGVSIISGTIIFRWFF